MTEIRDTVVSMSWFDWHFEQALKEAVRVHGLDATGFAWTASQHLKKSLPDGSATFHSAETIIHPPNPTTQET